MIDRQPSFPAWAITISLTVHGMLLFMFAAEMPAASAGVSLKRLSVRISPRASARVSEVSMPEPATPRPRYDPAPHRASQEGAKVPAVEADHASPKQAVTTLRARKEKLSMAAADPIATKDAADSVVALLVSPADDLRSYRFALASEIRRFRRYPDVARDSGWEGSVGVAVTVRPLGPPQVELTQSSGHEPLDEQALLMVRQAVHQTQVPDGVRSSGGRFELPIQFRLVE